MSNADVATAPRRIFSCAGIELEYMVVDVDTLDVKPIVQNLFAEVGCPGQSDVDRDKFTWSNELVAHVVELKLSRPEPSLTDVADGFQNELKRVNEALGNLGAKVLPTGMHPWMSPASETVLWPLEAAEIYTMYDNLFGCRQHGWANLQSMHINLPFHGDEEFRKLHTAIRTVLPLIPGLSASSPFCDGKFAGTLDTRLYAYGKSCSKIPECSGEMIPLPFTTEKEYDKQVFQPMYKALKPFDTENVLCEEYSNARGAIARFSRGSIEIRLIDTQECPRMDLAIASLVIRAVKALAEEQWIALDQQIALPQAELVALYRKGVHNAEVTVCAKPELLAAYGLESAASATVQDIWKELLRRSWPENEDTELRADAAWLLTHGSLARRILEKTGVSPKREDLKREYEALAACLATGQRYGK